MKLAIADPPYLGRAHTYYGVGPGARRSWHGKNSTRNGERVSTRTATSASRHSDARVWDDPETHRLLCAQLCERFDGFAIAMVPESLRVYLADLPDDVRVCVWSRPDAIPGGSRIIKAWEPVIVRIPPDRRRRSAGQIAIRDLLTASTPHIGHTGAKPAAWTRWSLELLGYDPDTDEVVDLFPGSGAISRELAQGVLL